MRKKVTNAEKPTGPQFFIKIERSVHEEVTREGDRNDRWDGDDTREDHEIHGFSVGKEASGWDFILPYDPTGKPLYLVCAFYDTGDSFHHSENHLCLVSLKDNLPDAQTILKFIEEDYKAYQEDSNTYKYKPSVVKLPSGVEEELYTGTWKGYFEHLREVRIEVLNGGMSVRF